MEPSTEDVYMPRALLEREKNVGLTIFYILLGRIKLDFVVKELHTTEASLIFPSHIFFQS